MILCRMSEALQRVVITTSLLTVRALLVSGQLAPCPVTEYDACTAVLINTVAKSSTAFPYFTDQEVQNLCRSCSELEACLARINLEGCLEYQLHVEGLQNSCTYFCKEGHQEYRTYRECFNNSELQEAGSVCNNTFARRQHSLSLNSQGLSQQDQRTLMCQYMSDFISCMQNAATSHCTPEAGEWVFRTNVEYFSPMMERGDCHSGSKIGVAIIFGTAIGLFTMMMVVIITSIVCRRKQRAPSTKASSNNCNTFSSMANERKNYKYQEAGSQSGSSAVWRKSNTTSGSCVASPTSPLSSPHFDDNTSDAKKSPLGPQQEMFLERNDLRDREEVTWLPSDPKQDMEMLKCNPSADVVV